MNSIEFIDYCSFLIEFNDFPCVENFATFGYGSCSAAPLNHFTNFEKPYSQLALAVFYIYKDPKTNIDDLLPILEEDIQALYGNHIKIVHVHAKKRWAYMPHYSLENLKAGYYQLFDSIQGHNHTFYCGGLFNGELVESCIKFSKSLVKRFFKSAVPCLTPIKELQFRMIYDEYIKKNLSGNKVITPSSTSFYLL